MKIFDVYCKVTEVVRNNAGTVIDSREMDKEFLTVGETPQQAAERASWEARGYNTLYPMIPSWQTGANKVIGVTVLKAIDLGYQCNTPVKHLINRTY